MVTFDLTDFGSSVWKRLEAHLRDEIDRLRVQNDSTHFSPEQTAALRGEIRALKKLLGLPKAPPVQPAEPDLY